MFTFRKTNHLKVKPSARKVGTLGGTLKVTDYNDDPAVGRTVLLLRKNISGTWYLASTTLTDSNGDYEFAVDSGPAEQLLVVGIGDLVLGERSVALSGIIGVG